jgi:hypothetical protein
MDENQLQVALAQIQSVFVSTSGNEDKEVEEVCDLLHSF